MEKFYETPPGRCSFPEERPKTNTTVYWVVANPAGDVDIVEKRSGCKLSSATFGCGCSKKTMPLEDVGAYLEATYAAGAFKKLVLAGAQPAVAHLRHFIPPALASLITTEIIEV